MQIKVSTTKLPESNSHIVGLANISLGNDIRIGSVSILEDSKGTLFINMPTSKLSRQGKDGKPEYTVVANPTTKEMHEKLYDAIFKSFESNEPVTIDDGKDAYLTISTNVYDTPYGNKQGDARLFINDSFVISGISIIETKQGTLYPAMPSFKTNKVDSKGKPIYSEIVSMSKGFDKELKAAIIRQFNAQKSERLANRITIKDRLSMEHEKATTEKSTTVKGKKAGIEK